MSENVEEIETQQNTEELDVDAILLQADPSLKEQFASLEVDLKDVSVLGESLNIDNVEHEENRNLSLRGRILFRTKKVFLKLSQILLEAFQRVKRLLIWTYKDGFKILVTGLKSHWSKVQSAINHVIGIFKTWSLVKKILFSVFVLTSVTSIYFYFWLIKSNYLNKSTYPYVGSIAEVATNEFKYDPETEVEPLYSSSRVKFFVFQLKPFIVNLKRVGSGNPMGMFELAIEGNSTDVMVEIKGRESEVRDIIERVVETKTFNSLETVQGKDGLRDELRQEINLVLKKGEVSHVQFLNFIVKP